MDFFVVVVIFAVSLILVEGGYLTLRSLQNPEKREVMKRLKILSSKEYENESIDILRKNLLSDVQWFNQMLLNFRWSERVNRFLQQADAQYTLGVYVLLSLLLAVVGFLAGSLMNLSRMALVFLVVFLGATPFLTICFKKKRRMEKFQKQLPGAMELIARALKAGHAFTSGLRMVADELGDPIGPEFEKTLQEINFGMGVPEALKNLPERVDCPDLRFFIISVILQRETGGNLAEILEKIAQIIQERFKLQAHIRVLSAEGKLSSIILIALPFVITIALYVLNPIYIKTLFSDPMGRLMIAYALLMMVIGIFVMKRMITIKV